MVGVETRETREGWPLLTVETEVNGEGTQRGQMKGVLFGLVYWACRAGTRDFCSALAALVGPAQTISFLSVHYFFSPIAQQAGHWAGSRAGSPISYCVSLVETDSARE
jgi:hypothetical protein